MRIAWVRAQYSSDRIPKWVVDFGNTKDYRGYLHSIGVSLPDEKGDVPMGVSDESGDDHGDNGESESDSDVSEGASLQQPSTSVANHTERARIYSAISMVE